MQCALISLATARPGAAAPATLPPRIQLEVEAGLGLRAKPRRRGAEVAEKLKREFLELLEKDVEFRYATAGYPGFSEILKRLEEHDKKFYELLTEIRALRESQEKL